MFREKRATRLANRCGDHSVSEARHTRTSVALLNTFCADGCGQSGIAPLAVRFSNFAFQVSPWKKFTLAADGCFRKTGRVGDKELVASDVLLCNYIKTGINRNPTVTCKRGITKDSSSKTSADSQR